MNHTHETCKQVPGAACNEAPARELLQQNTPDAYLEQQALEQRLAGIRRRILVMSGKGGVGKSTVAANLAVSLALQGRKVGLLDVDIHGPSIPAMLKLSEAKLQVVDGAIVPVECAGLRVMSIGFMLQNRDDALIWRGPMKHSVIKQFLKDVAWGRLDYLILDAPPGTGDEPLAVCQLAAPLDGAILVTTPQQVAANDVRKSVMFCRKLDLPILGIVENMSGFACPHCGMVTAIFHGDGGGHLADEYGVPLLGRIPLDPAVGAACDAGTPFVYHHNLTTTAKTFEAVAMHILDAENATVVTDSTKTEKGKKMKLAIPMAGGELCMHFGHCEQFALLECDREEGTVRELAPLTPPPHEPGVLPRWLQAQGVTVVIAGGMGQRAQALFAEHGIEVVVGVSGGAPAELARGYLTGTLQGGENICDH